MKKFRFLLLSLFAIQALYLYFHFQLGISPTIFPIWPVGVVSACLLIVNFIFKSTRIQTFPLQLFLAFGMYLSLLTLALSFPNFLQKEYFPFVLVDIAALFLIALVAKSIRGSLLAYELAFATLGAEGLNDIDAPAAKNVIQSEFMRSRYSTNPLSLIKIKTEVQEMSAINQELLQEVFAQNQERFQLSQIANQVKQEIRLIDHLFFDGNKNELLIVCPEYSKENAQKFSQLLKTKLESSSSIKIETILAAFPENGVTFNSLLNHLSKKERSNYLMELEETNSEDYDFITQSP